ncbi:hypothetical protein [Bacillus phage CP-51]|uniref:Uncharacterized protein n=1 Tax=Bacillus phage CP-51 TaxID=1391188 RepID=A0A068EU62_9CAUD|nr:hypothetical protein OZ73_gp111 [Bacillus phage CP-51]AID50546.1 hypothetical protein [Bacillus phage CP-51]
MRINRIVGECSCNNCLDRGLTEAYKIYVGRTNTTTTIVLCVACLIRLDADIHKQVGKIAMSDRTIALQKGMEE